jgi:hypothetical protein
MSAGTMGCRRAEELFSDHEEAALNEVLREDLERHLRACEDCRALREAFKDVMGALREAPAIEPPADLARRVADGVLARAARLPQARPGPARRPAPAWLQAAAAVALLIAGAAALAAGPDAGPLRSASRVLERGDNAVAYLSERKDRLIEDIRILRVVIGAAFEGRLDRVNDRFDDYRRLLEKRRAAEGRKRSQAGASGEPEPAVERAEAIFSNSGPPALVTPGGRDVAKEEWKS